MVGDDGNRTVAVFGTAGDVDHETLDVRQEHNLLAAHEFGAADEDEGGEDDALNEFAATVAPLAHLLLCCYIYLIVFLALRLRRDACLKPFATELFGVVVDDGNIPILGDFGRFCTPTAPAVGVTVALFVCIGVLLSILSLVSLVE